MLRPLRPSNKSGYSFFLYPLLLIAILLGSLTACHKEKKLEEIDQLNAITIKTLAHFATSNYPFSKQSFIHETSGLKVTPSAIDERLKYIEQYLLWQQNYPCSSKDLSNLENSKASIDPWREGGRLLQALRCDRPLELTNNPNTLEFPTLHAQAVTFEALGRFQEARDYYQRLIPFGGKILSMEGYFRIAFRQVDEKETRRTAKELQHESPSHPYLAIVDLGHLSINPYSYDSSPKEPSLFEVEAPQDRFLRGVSELQKLERAIYNAHWESSISNTHTLLQLEKRGYFAFIAGIAAIRSGNIDLSESLFSVAFDHESLLYPFKKEAQILALSLWLQSGRPDIVVKHLKKELNTFKEILGFDKESGERRPALHVDRKAFYLLAAASTAELGSVEQAQQIFDLLGEEGPARDTAHLLEALLKQSYRPYYAGFQLPSPVVAVLRCNEAYLNGDLCDWKTLIALLAPLKGDELYTSVLKSTISEESVRASIAAFNWIESRINLNKFLTPINPQFDYLHLIVHAGSNQTTDQSNPEFSKLLSRLLDMRPTGSTAKLDLATAFFLNGDLALSEEQVDDVLKANERNRRGHFIKSLILKMNNNSRRARYELRRAYHSSYESPLMLTTLGTVALRLQRYKSAKSYFYKAFMKDRDDADAIEGLGYAMYEAKLSSPTHLFDRLLKATNDDSVDSQVALRKWLAIFSGSREGRQKGLTHLLRAIDRVGQRHDLLSELAQYYMALQEYSKAEYTLIKAFRLSFAYPKTQYLLAKLFNKTNKLKKEQEALKQYLRLAPHGEYARESRRRLDQLLSNQ